jgi:hypothetical protein
MTPNRNPGLVMFSLVLDLFILGVQSWVLINFEKECSGNSGFVPLIEFLQELKHEDLPLRSWENAAWEKR